MVMLAEYGTLSLAEVLAPAIQMADGYPIEAQLVERDRAARRRGSRSGRARSAVFLPHAGEAREAPQAGEIFRQADLAATLRKLVDAERRALAAGKSRKEAIYAAYDRFYKGDIAQELVRGTREQGGLFTAAGPRELEGAHRGAGQDHLQGDRGLQAHQSGRRGRRCCRR